MRVPVMLDVEVIEVVIEVVIEAVSLLELKPVGLDVELWLAEWLVVGVRAAVRLVAPLPAML